MQYMTVGDGAGLLAQMRRGTVQYCVLALLAGDDRYGLEITRTLADAGGLVTSEGTVYPLLTRLRSEGLVETYWRESTEGPPRRYYRLTEEGRGSLAAFRIQWATFRHAVDAILNEEQP